MKNEKQIIDDLGEWLCMDMEKALVRALDPRLPLSTDRSEKILFIRDVAERIKFYRDNCLDT